MSGLTLQPPRATTADAHRKLLELFERSGFVMGGPQDVLRATDESLARKRDLPAHLRRLARDESALAILSKLFVLNASVDPDSFERTLGTDDAKLLADTGLVASSAHEIRPLVRIVPHERFWITSDIDYLEANRHDHVAGVHRPSATLARLTIRRKVERALDVGTGNGIQALLLSDHANRVVATDVNERALAFAEFNAALNDVHNIEFRAGSFLDPVEGERFGVVASNPPYVISPESEYVFRDSGLGRDRVSEQLVRALPAVVDEDGFASVMVSWIEEGGDPAARPRDWVNDLPVAALVVHSHTEDALTSAVIWNQNAGSDDEVAERIERWMTYYESEAIDALGYGAIIMRNGGPTWVRALGLPPAIRFTAASDHLQRLFRAHDFLESSPDLFAQRLSFPEDVVLEQRLAPAREGWVAKGMTLTLHHGLGFDADLDAQSARIVTELATATSVGTAVDAVARELGTDAPSFRRTAEPLIRRLLEFGYLVSPG